MWDLKTHIRSVHVREKPVKNHVCSVCGKTLSGSAGLKTQIRIHTDENIITVKCDRAFTLQL